MTERKEMVGMNKTKKYAIEYDKSLLLSTDDLQAVLACGRASAVKIGTAAGAKVTVGRRVMWYRSKVEKYVEQIAI